ncbi:gliding motility protein GldM [Draconibacterium sp.]|nr:gliding motility protein GldM [Draconibacterium sp.]
MGAKNCPESPRQKMINMMYIVLTAMLALNVAAQVLEAFRVVDSSLIHTLNAVDMKNNQIYTSFQQAYIENPAKVQEWKEKADKVQKSTSEMFSYISQLKEELINYSGSDIVSEEFPLQPEDFYYVTENGDTLIVDKQDDLNAPSELMITQEKASELKAKIQEYKNGLLALLDESDVELIESIQKELETPDPITNLKNDNDNKTWEAQYFLDKPLVAILTLLSKIQIDVKNSEANLINFLYAQIDAGSFKFNKLGARVIANSNLVLQGEPYEAEVFLAAEDSTQQPKIFINNREVKVVDGKANYTVNTSESGIFKWSGLIKYKTPAGIYKDYPFEQEYQVTEPSVTMSATNMNVFYLGIDNPFDIGGGGIAKENLSVTMSNGKIAKSGSAYVIKPSALDELGKRTKVTVSATIGGQKRVVGTSEWRVKKVPDPVAQINGQSGGDIQKEVLAIQDGVLAVLEDFDFDFKYTVTQFELQTAGSSGFVITSKATSNRFTAEQKDQLQRIKPGTIVYIGAIQAKGDDGSTRDLDPISFRVR